MTMASRNTAQRGGFALGMVLGVLLGLALALGVALYISKVPVPFVDKVPQRTAEQDAAGRRSRGLRAGFSASAACCVAAAAAHAACARGFGAARRPFGQRRVGQTGG